MQLLGSTSLLFVRYCKAIKEEPIAFLKGQNAADYKAFCQWVLDNYPGVNKHSTLHEYWRQLRMQYQNQAKNRMPNAISDDVNNVSCTRRGPTGSIFVTLCCSTSVILRKSTGLSGRHQKSRCYLATTCTCCMFTIGCTVKECTQTKNRG